MGSGPFLFPVGIVGQMLLEKKVGLCRLGHRISRGFVQFVVFLARKCAWKYECAPFSTIPGRNSFLSFERLSVILE